MGERTLLPPSSNPPAGNRRLAILLVVCAGLALNWACSGTAKDTEEPVPVQIVAVQQSALQETVTTDAVLFPLAQAAIIPKISAPVKKFYVNRGTHVREGQLLAVLENRDLVASAQENQG
ncbi:MAG TPA: efflux RND transporter periplasmic adaptor subunit, partial [Terriglobales bacterium]